MVLRCLVVKWSWFRMVVRKPDKNVCFMVKNVRNFMVRLIKWSDHLKTGQKKCLTSQIFIFQVFRWLLYKFSMKEGVLSYKDVLHTLAPAHCSFVLYSGDPITGHLNYGTIQIVDNSNCGNWMLFRWFRNSNCGQNNSTATKWPFSYRTKFSQLTIWHSVNGQFNDRAWFNHSTSAQVPYWYPDCINLIFTEHSERGVHYFYWWYPW